MDLSAIIAAGLSAAVTGGLGIIGGVLAVRAGKRKGRQEADLELSRLAAERDSSAAQADAAQAQAVTSITAAAAGLVQPLTAQVQALTAEVQRLRTLEPEVARLRWENARLTEQVGLLQARVDHYETVGR